MAGSLIANCARRLLPKYNWYLSIVPKKLPVARVPSLQNEIQRIWTSSYSLEQKEDRLNEDYDTFMKERRPQTSLTKQYLQDEFGFNQEEVRRIMRNNKGLSELNLSDIIKNYDICTEAGITKDVVKSNIWVVSIPPSILKEKIRAVSRLGIDDPNGTVPFMSLHPNKIQNMISFFKKEQNLHNGNRIKYLCEKLKCDTQFLCQAMVKHGFLQTIKIGKIEEILNVLHAADVKMEDVLKDLWVLRYNPTNVEARLKRALDVGIKPIKPWMGRCLEHNFVKLLEKAQNRREVLGENSDIVEYLCQRFNCDKVYMDHILQRYPSLKKVNIGKVKEIIDILFDEGFTAKEIQLVPELFFHSIKTLKERLSELIGLGHRPASLFVLCRSRRQYAVYVNKIKSLKDT